MQSLQAASGVGQWGRALPPSPLGMVAVESYEPRKGPSLDGPIMIMVGQETEDGRSLPAGVSFLGTEKTGWPQGWPQLQEMMRQAGRAWMPGWGGSVGVQDVARRCQWALLCQGPRVTARVVTSRSASLTWWRHCAMIVATSWPRGAEIRASGLALQSLPFPSMCCSSRHTQVEWQ